MTLDQVSHKFPAVHYKVWLLKNPRRDSSIASIASAPVSRHDITHDVTRSMSLPVRLTRSAYDAAAKPNASGELEDNVHPLDLEKSLPTHQTSAQNSVSQQSGDVAVARAFDDSGIHDSAALPVSSSDDVDTCAICLAPFNDEDEIRGLTCGHAFHVVCIDNWLSTRRACCPVCIADMTT